MHELLNKRIAINVLPTPTGGAGGPVDFNATGDKYIFTSPVPIDVYRWGFITIEAMDPDAGGFVLALDYRPTVGSDTSRVEVGSITRADANTVAAGAVVYHDLTLAVAESTTAGLGATTQRINVGPDGPYRVEPGAELVIEVTNAVGAASTGYVWIEYVQQPFDISGDDVTLDTD